MFKSVLVIILVIGILWVSRVVLQRVKPQASAKNRSDSTNSKDTIQCIHCKTYIAREDAIIKDNKSFCSQQHLEDWNRSA